MKCRLVAGSLVFALRLAAAADMPAAQHTRAEFRVTVHLPYSAAAPLFGAWTEQQWSPDWKPEFLYPAPPGDQEGAVFKVRHGSHASIWMTTVFDLPGGHIQYVYVLNGLLITRIDLRLHGSSENETEVSVVYERTALDPAANDHLNALAESDAGQGPRWQAALDAYAAARRGPPK
jgi:hypothetical protein